MTVDPDTAATTTEHAGRSYYFCSMGCAQRFGQSPEKYAAATIDSSKPPASCTTAAAASTGLD